MSGRTIARIAARYSASARGVSEADLQHVNMLLHPASAFLASVNISFPFKAPDPPVHPSLSPRCRSYQAMLALVPTPGPAPVSSGAPVPGKKLPPSCRWMEMYITFGKKTAVDEPCG